MAETLLARCVQTDRCEWTELSAPDTVHQGDWQDLSRAAHAAKVILLLPATQVLLFTVDLPGVPSRQLQKALPYAIEDWLANEVETYHLVWHKLPEGKVAVAAIAHELLQAIVGHCQSSGIPLAALYAETLLLPFTDGMVSVLLTGQQAAVRYGPWQGGGGDLELLPLLIARAFENTTEGGWPEKPPTVQIFGGPLAEGAWPEGMAAQFVPVEQPLLMLAANLPDKPILNLLSGPYSPTDASGLRWQYWLPACALLVLAVCLQYGVTLNHYWHGQKQLEALETANKDLFKQTFPEIKRIVNIKAQAEQGLQALRKQSHDTGSVYLRLFYQTGAALAQNPNLQMQAFDFSNNMLSLQLTAPDLADIEQFKQLMQNSHGLNVTIQSADKNAQGIFAHINISGQAG